MQIAKIELPYDTNNKLTAAQCEELKAAQFVHPIFAQMPIVFKPVEGTELFETDFWCRGFIVDLDKIDTVSVTITCRLRLTDSLNKVADQTQLAFNERVQVVVPSANLLHIDEVKVAEDCCTDVLREYMREGWKILAICPQPNQRRPDYVLGRRGQ